MFMYRDGLARQTGRGLGGGSRKGVDAHGRVYEQYERCSQACYSSPHLQVFVWKEIDYGGMTEKEKQLLVQEVNLLRELRHPHIVRYHDRIIARPEATLYIIMEHCQGGDLAAIIAKCRTER